jgi:6-pyruvoyltetrahydropterin/6-carboxytetrahydropterin synthase
MRMSLWVSETFEAAHQLSMLFGPAHPCSRMHGHRYMVRVVVEAEDNGEPILVDYHELQKRLHDECSKLDHQCLNDIIKVPTCEELSRFLMRAMEDLHPSEVMVQEQEGTGCVLRVR